MRWLGKRGNGGQRFAKEAPRPGEPPWQHAVPPLRPNRYDTATHRALPEVQVLGSRRRDLHGKRYTGKCNANVLPHGHMGSRKRRSPKVWCNIDPRYAGKCNAGKCNAKCNARAGGTHNSPSAAPLVLAPRMVHRLLRASRGLRARACCYKEATRILKVGGTKRTRRATGIGIARAL